MLIERSGRRFESTGVSTKDRRKSKIWRRNVCMKLRVCLFEIVAQSAKKICNLFE